MVAIEIGASSTMDTVIEIGGSQDENFIVN
jgi:hypothetical protein